MIVRRPEPLARSRAARLRAIAVLALAGLSLTWAGPASGEPEPVPVEPAPVGAAAEAATTGSIAGTVTSGGSAVSGLEVLAWNPSNGAGNAATTDATGRYVISGLAPATYVVEFRPGGTGFVREYYDDAMNPSDAQPVTVTAGATTSGIDADLVVGGRIRGTVTGPDGPVAYIPVVASASGFSSNAVTYTGADGVYEIPGLLPGDYVVRFAGTDAGLLEEYYDNAPDALHADLVHVTGTATTAGIDALLDDGASISGVVQGPSGPQVNVHVVAEEIDGSGYADGYTGFDGTYVVGGLPPGSYRVRFTGSSGYGLREEYYDDVLSWRAATPVLLTGTQEVTGIDAVLAREGDPVFSDVPDGAPFRTEIEWLAYQGMTTGYPDGTFRPSAPVERQAMAAFLYRFAGSPSFTAPATPTFADVPASSPFYTAVEWLVAHDITTGWPDGTFRPAATIERQAMAAFLYRFAGEPGFTPPATASFSDVPTSAAFFDEVEWLASTGITTGWPDGTFRPTARVERQAMAAFLQRFDEWRRG